MPELPEVEDAARRLRNAIQSKRISSVEALHRSIARSLTATSCRTLIGRTVVSVNRRAKIQLITLDDDQLLEVHFRMTGDWDIGRHDDPPVAFERARFLFDDGTRVSFVDGRAFGVLRLHAAAGFTLPSLGPEPLDDAFDATTLHRALATRRGPIKPVLLDQRVIAGLGNIYAAEALWRARIRPDTPANSISRVRVARLRDAIVDALRDAPVGRYYERDRGAAAASAPESSHHGTATLRDVSTAEAWKVYDREGEPCLRCNSRIVRTTQAGRSTYWCRKCQR